MKHYMRIWKDEQKGKRPAVTKKKGGNRSDRRSHSSPSIGEFQRKEPDKLGDTYAALGMRW